MYIIACVREIVVIVCKLSRKYIYIHIHRSLYMDQKGKEEMVDIDTVIYWAKYSIET